MTEDNPQPRQPHPHAGTHSPQSLSSSFLQPRVRPGPKARGMGSN